MLRSSLNWWRSPYNLREKLDFVKYRFLAPKPIPSNFIQYDLQDIGKGLCRLTPVQDDFSIIFTGDLMPFGDYPPKLSSDLSDFIFRSDYIVFNIEGVVTKKKRFLALTHSQKKLMEFLEIHGGVKTVLNVANNHSSDFGHLDFQRQNSLFREKGYLVFGDNEKPMIIEDSVALFPTTFLSNQILLPGIPSSESKINTWEQRYLIDDNYNIFMPHWGYEMHLHPSKQQVLIAKKLIPTIFDSIVGNHSHSPHPVYRLADNSILATSLGNFCYLNKNPNHWFGCLLRLSFAKAAENLKPILTSVEIVYIKQNLEKKGIFIQSVSSLDYKNSRSNINYFGMKYLRNVLK